MSLAGAQDARDIGTIHASALTFAAKPFCPRSYVIMDVEKVKAYDEWLGTSLKVTFDHGNDMQARLNNEYLPETMYGDWVCKVCGTRKVFKLKPKKTCKCMRKIESEFYSWEYEEPAVSMKDEGIEGHIDSVVDIHQKKLRLAEVKTMVKDKFAALKAPLAEHTLRTNLYMRMVEQSDEPWAKKINTQVGSVLYMVKGYGTKCEKIRKWGIPDMGFSPFREFEVIRDDSKTDYLLSMAKAVHSNRQGKTGIPCGICPTSTHRIAKACPVRKQCFSKKYPHEITWRDHLGKKVHKGKPCV